MGQSKGKLKKNFVSKQSQKSSLLQEFIKDENEPSI